MKPSYHLGHLFNRQMQGCYADSHLKNLAMLASPRVNPGTEVSKSGRNWPQITHLCSVVFTGVLGRCHLDARLQANLLPSLVVCRWHWTAPDELLFASNRPLESSSYTKARFYCQDPHLWADWRPLIARWARNFHSLSVKIFAIRSHFVFWRYPSEKWCDLRSRWSLNPLHQDRSRSQASASDFSWAAIHLFCLNQVTFVH